MSKSQISNSLVAKAQQIGESVVDEQAAFKTSLRDAAHAAITKYNTQYKAVSTPNMESHTTSNGKVHNYPGKVFEACEEYAKNKDNSIKLDERDKQNLQTIIAYKLDGYWQESTTENHHTISGDNAKKLIQESMELMKKCRGMDMTEIAEQFDRELSGSPFTLLASNTKVSLTRPISNKFMTAMISTLAELGPDYCNDKTNLSKTVETARQAMCDNSLDISRRHGGLTISKENIEEVSKVLIKHYGRDASDKEHESNLKNNPHLMEDINVSRVKTFSSRTKEKLPKVFQDLVAGKKVEIKPHDAVELARMNRTAFKQIFIDGPKQERAAAQALGRS